MSGKWVIVVTGLTVALALLGGMLVAGRYEAAQSGPDVLRTASPAQANPVHDGPTQIDDNSEAQSLSQPGAGADQLRVVRAEAGDQAEVQPEVQPEVQARMPTKTAAQNQAEVGSSSSTSKSGSVDDSFVGQPFPVSESVLANCVKYGSCEQNKALLAEMADEPREEPWATEAERAIRALVELKPGTNEPRQVTYTIRALECRKTICFVETASHMDTFHSQFYPFHKANYGLDVGYAMSSSETKEDGTKVYVTLLPVTRR